MGGFELTGASGSVPKQQPKIKLHGNLGLGAEASGHIAGAVDAPFVPILTAGLDAGLAVNYTPNGGNTNIHAEGQGIFGYGFKAKGSLGVEQRLNDKLSLDVTGYTQRLTSGITNNAIVTSTASDGVNFAQVTAKADYNLGQNTTGLDTTLNYKPSNKITLSGGIGVKYTNSTNDDIHISSKTFVNSGMGNRSELERTASAAAKLDQKLEASSVSSNLKGSIMFEPSKNTYAKAGFQVDPANFSNNSSVGISFGVKL